MTLSSGDRLGAYEILSALGAGFDDGRRFLVSVLVPVTAPQVITVGHNWMANLPGNAELGRMTELGNWRNCDLTPTNA